MKVLLVGTFAAAAQPLLERFLQSRCEMVSFGGRFDECQVLPHLWNADVVIGAPFTRAMGERARQLRLIQNTGAGIDRYDVSSFPAGVRLCASYHHESAMAEYVILAILALTRRLLWFDAQMRQGWWSGSCIFNPLSAVSELLGRVVGLIGPGRVGAEVARRARSLGMRVRAVGRTNAAASPIPHVETAGGPANLPELLSISDYIVVTCPLTGETEGLIGAEQFSRMKPEAYLINIARGKIVQEQALYEALRTRQIAGAAIDVWYQYPPADHRTPFPPSAYPFHELDNVIMTPHISCCTHQTAEARWRDIAYNIDHIDSGDALRNEIILRR